MDRLNIFRSRKRFIAFSFRFGPKFLILLLHTITITIIKHFSHYALFFPSKDSVLFDSLTAWRMNAFFLSAVSTTVMYFCRSIRPLLVGSRTQSLPTVTLLSLVVDLSRKSRQAVLIGLELAGRSISLQIKVK